MARAVADAACFPLIPFSNRIAEGRFRWNGRDHTIAPNFPGSDHPHPLHGFGWLAAWEVLEASSSHALLDHCYPGGEWVWPYRAIQEVRLSPGGLELSLSLTNLGAEQMPAGIGFHPFFPRTRQTRYRGLHRGEWHNDQDCIPVKLDLGDALRDWWDGAPVGSRNVDTVFAGREGVLEIDWPERGLGLTLECSDSLPFTVVYTPENADWFCVEPVSHMTDAVNRDLAGSGLVSLAPQETLYGSVGIRAVAKGEDDD